MGRLFYDQGTERLMRVAVAFVFLLGKLCNDRLGGQQEAADRGRSLERPATRRLGPSMFEVFSLVLWLRAS